MGEGGLCYRESEGRPTCKQKAGKKKNPCWSREMAFHLKHRGEAKSRGLLDFPSEGWEGGEGRCAQGKGEKPNTSHVYKAGK